MFQRALSAKGSGEGSKDKAREKRREKTMEEHSGRRKPKIVKVKGKSHRLTGLPIAPGQKWKLFLRQALARDRCFKGCFSKGMTGRDFPKRHICGRGGWVVDPRVKKAGGSGNGKGCEKGVFGHVGRRGGGKAFLWRAMRHGGVWCGCR